MFIVARADSIMRARKTHSDYTPISVEGVVAAVRTVLDMNFKEKEALCDQIHADQPHVFLTMVALSQSGVSLPEVDHALHLLMVIYLAFKNGAGVRLANSIHHHSGRFTRASSSLLAIRSSVPTQPIGLVDAA